MTVLEVIQAATKYLEERHVPDARLNAEHLVGHGLGKQRLELYLEFDRPLNDQERSPIRELIKKRAAREPLQHLLGTVEFFRRTFRSDSRALIPRPETEQLAELIIERLRSNPPTSVADIGTGTGILAITLAAEFPQSRVIGTDLSPDAIALARENATALETNNVEFVECDLLPEPGSFDLIISNPPYIPTGQIEHLQEEVRFDPPLALDGGADGLDIIRRLVQRSATSLAPGGLLALEIGHDQTPAVHDLLAAENYRDIAGVEDYQGRERFVFASHG